MTAGLAALVVVVLARWFRPRPERPAPPHGTAAGIGPRLARSAAWFVPAVRRRRERRAGLAPSAVADWCGDIARSVRAGDALRFALQQTIPAESQLRSATDQLRVGLDRGRSVADIADARVEVATSRRGPDHLGLACSVLAVCGRLGGSAAAPLDRAATALRQRAADDQERHAQAAQARLSAHVLTLVPLSVLGLMALADDGVRGVLASPVGAACLLAGGGLNACGWLWMRRIIDRTGR